jgi:REase_MTES_1575
VPVHDLLELLGPARAASTASLSTEVTPRTIGRWLASGKLVRLHPGWVTVPALAQDWNVRAYAATGYAGGPLSHMSALAVHGVVDHEVTRLDVTVAIDCRVRTSRWLRIHRAHRRPALVVARGLPATTIARSVVDTWGAAHRAAAVRGFDSVARGALLRATRERRVRPEEVAAEVSRRPNLPGRSELLELLRLITGGSQSELEIFGVRHLLSIPGLPAPRQQHRVLLPDGPVFLDAAWPGVKLAVELDGAAFHGSPEARERDLRRDAALAALGWLVLRFSYRRATRDPEACRRQIAAVYRQRLSTVPAADNLRPEMSG